MGSRMVRRTVLISASLISASLGSARFSAGLASPGWSGLAFGLASAVAAQPAETGCRKTNALTGIYVQPSLESSSRGILASGQTVRLEVTGAGTGWARVTEPLIGWVEAKYLTPAACSGFTATAQPAAQLAVQPATIQPSGATATLPGATPGNIAASATAPVTCDVLPAEGLAVRSEPTTASNVALQILPKGTYQFQFTRDHVRSHEGQIERDWAYITAPYQGWIAVGVVGGQFNLGGKTCG